MRTVGFDSLFYGDDGIYLLDDVPFTGIAVDHFPDGRMRSEVRFKKGRQEGVSKEWYENGQIKNEAEYLGDGFHGKAKEWHVNGQLKKEATYEFGIPLELKEWDKEGKLTNEFRLQPSDWRYEILNNKRSIWGQKS